MSKQLILAEKPSVAREIARVLGIRGGGRNGFIEGPGHVVTWAVGHLVNIAEPEVQNKAWAGRWDLGRLPMIPIRFTLGVLPRTREQFETIKHLMGREEVTEIVNATDAGREGELIFRRIYLKAGCSKPILRLWASDMTEEGLKKSLARLVTGEEKRNLGLAAFARAEADWLIGMNFSRLFTLKAGSLLTVGRVQTPVLKLLVDRKQEIEHFVPKDFWTVEGSFAKGEDDPFKAVWYAPLEYQDNKIWVEQEAADTADRCRDRTGNVLGVNSKQGRQNPPLPFDLTTLQREANTRFGYSAKQTLGIAQDLYEKKKVLTYPRTDSRYLTRELFKEILSYFRAVYPHFPDIARQAAEGIKEGKRKFACVNDKKVSDHHAIIPTARKATREQFTPDQWNVYEMVCRRFCAAFMPAAAYRSSVVWVEVKSDRFKATGKIFKDRGWLVAEPWRAARDNPLPALRKGDAVRSLELESIKRTTKPPAHFTDATLLGAMETAGKLVDDQELREAMKERGLGTPATRAQIIETLLSRKYVEKKGKKLIATSAGERAIAMIDRMLPVVASPEMTGEWESKLKAIETGKMTYSEFMHEIRHMVAGNVHSLRQVRF
jgi:DNA topoisomerase-3